MPGHLVAGKTGTTQDYRDAWFVGCIDGKGDRRLARQRADNRPMPVRAEAAFLPARLFHDIVIAGEFIRSDPAPGPVARAASANLTRIRPRENARLRPALTGLSPATEIQPNSIDAPRYLDGM